MASASVNPHGGDIYKASEQYGIKKEDLLDYSANINPLGVPLELRKLIISNIDNLVNYPEPECESLRVHIGKYLNVQEKNIIVGNGASEIIFLLFDILKPERVLIPAPSFSEYSQAAERYGAEIKYLELDEANGFKLNVGTLIDSITDDISVVMLCNPNNPTSTLVTKDDLLRLLISARKRNVTVIIDEAFIELTEGGNANSIIEFVMDFDNLFIVRAFTKLFAIPGMRLGYGIGNLEIIDKMWAKKLPWSVNTFACSFGEFLVKSGEYLEKTALWIKEERKWFYNQLKEITKLRVYEPNTNFILLKLINTDYTVFELRDQMAARGILIRNASNFKFLNEKFFRLAIKDRASNMRFLEVLREVMDGRDLV